MKRITCVVAALGLLVGACGSGDADPAADEPAAEEPADAEATAEEPPAEEPPAEDPPAEDPPAEDPPAEDPPAEDPPAEDPPAEDPPADDGGDDDDGDVLQVRSMSDIPEECRRLMAEFLREVEPIVSSIDWETATLGDFEAISAQFDPLSEEFDTMSQASGCNDFEFVGGNEFELLIEFARDEAPGTVGFFEFFNTLSEAVDVDGNAGSGGEDALQTCEEGIAFIQSLLDNYDSLNQVPAAEAMKFAQIGSLFMTCTPEQLEFLDSPEVTEFLGG